MSIFHALEGQKLRTVLVLASSEACLPALRDHIAENPQRHFHLALLKRPGSDLSLRRGAEPGLADLAFGGQGVPGNVGLVHSAAATDPAMLASAARLVWFRDAAEPFPPPPEGGDHACATNAALGVRFGLPLRCYGPAGRRIATPLTGDLGRFAHDALDAWLAERLAFTERVRRFGIVLQPDASAPLIASRLGHIRPGNLTLPAGLIWRIRRLELAVADHSGATAAAFRDGGAEAAGMVPEPVPEDLVSVLVPEEQMAEERTVQAQLIEAELQACADALRRLLGTSVKIDAGR